MESCPGDIFKPFQEKIVTVEHSKRVVCLIEESLSCLRKLRASDNLELWASLEAFSHQNRWICGKFQNKQTIKRSNWKGQQHIRILSNSAKNRLGAALKDLWPRGCVWIETDKGSNKKKREKSGQAARLGGGVTPLQPDSFYFVKILTHFIPYKMAK